MSKTTLVRFLPGGGVRKLFETRDRDAYGAVPRRASRVEVVDDPNSPCYGKFHVDFSPLGPEYQFCLRQVFDDYQLAVQAEQEWLAQNWVLKGLSH